MMKRVPAPDGFEGSRCYEDAIREWAVYARPVGATWWTKCGFAGHPGLAEEELDQKSTVLINQWVGLGMVK